MSRKFKRHYSGYNRHILAEFITEEELNELDIKYTSAKIKRLTERIKKDTGADIKLSTPLSEIIGKLPQKSQ